MLQVEHLRCGYGGEPVIKDLSFSVAPGDRLCVLGPNGCGKTTLLRAVSGLLPAQGKVTVCGEALSKLSRKKSAQKIALMSQMSSVYFSYTVYETVMLGRYAHMRQGLLAGEREEDRKLVLESLRRTGTLELKDKLITELSGGQLQRVFLARTFAQDPQIILLDEPTNHLDLKYQLQLVEDLKDWARQGERCVVGVLHDINLALAFANQILLLDEGRAVAFGKAEEFDLSLISQIYHVDVEQYMRSYFQRWEHASSPQAKL